MKKINLLITSLLISGMTFQATAGEGEKPNLGENKEKNSEQKDDFQYLAEQFADLKIIRYQIPG